MSLLAALLTVSRVMAAVPGLATGRHSEVSMSQPSLVSACSSDLPCTGYCPQSQQHWAQHRACSANQRPDQDCDDQSEASAEYLTHSHTHWLSLYLSILCLVGSQNLNFNETALKLLDNTIKILNQLESITFSVCKFRYFFCYLICLFIKWQSTNQITTVPLTLLLSRLHLKLIRNITHRQLIQMQCKVWQIHSIHDSWIKTYYNFPKPKSYHTPYRDLCCASQH